jgi:membrane fusion protein (multidrug efflux system)
MFEPKSRETSGQTLLQARRSESVPVHEAGEPYGPAADEANRLRTPARREQPFEPDEDLGPRERSVGDETRKSWLRRHPFAVGLALLCVLLGVPAGYFYWDCTSHFEYTDDAYIAARQFAIAPEVSGYITAVPVTDNEHVAAGQVIARIDDRTYRAALAQAEAQVAAARASIDNMMHS